MGDCTEPDTSHFLGYGLGLVKSMWDDEGTTRANMIEILISLASVKLRI
jgi:hypothetical protein